MDSVSREKNQHRRPKPGSPAAIAEAQRIFREFVPEGVSLVDELLEDRRREVELESLDSRWQHLPMRSISP